MKKIIKTSTLPHLFMTAVIISFIYIVVRFYLYIFAADIWYEILFGIVLLLSEGFILIHGTGYLIDLIRVIKHKKVIAKQRKRKKKLKSFPPIVILIPSYNEPIDVIEATIANCYNLNYPNKKVILLDDTRYDKVKRKKRLKEYKLKVEKLCKAFGISLFRRPWRAAKAGIINDFIDYTNNKKIKDVQLNDFSEEKADWEYKYIVIFDADQNPFPDFLDNLVVQMEDNPKLAFIQTPQYYTNFETNRISKTAGMQQVVFYEYICEGKSINNSMFCCGTNVIFRKDALIDVGKFDETTVTEDFATSIKFIMNGWETRYDNTAKAFGLGPEDLGNYFKQQFRWALGTVTELRRNFVRLFTNPRSLSPSSWWEYFISSSYYLIGLVYLILMICPISYLLFNIPSYFGDFKIYGIIFVPYFFATLSSFFWSLNSRGYSPKDILLAQCLIFLSFPVYIRASFYALIGKKAKFAITSKKVSKEFPLIRLWPQLIMATLCFVAIVWGINKLMFEPVSFLGVLINILWCSYNFIILSSVFYFNTEEKYEKDTSTSIIDTNT